MKLVLYLYLNRSMILLVCLTIFASETQAELRLPHIFGDWRVCAPETVQLFSAVGYIFGRRIQQVAKVPIGLIDTSWGGTTVEATAKQATIEVDLKAGDYDLETLLEGGKGKPRGALFVYVKAL